MKKILVLNCGSSSIKYRLFGSRFNQIIVGLVEKIGEKGTRLVHTKGTETLEEKANVRDHKEAIALMLRMLHDRRWGAVKDIKEIAVVGHRVVHGGGMRKPSLLSEKTVKYLKQFELLAPLHNPHNITGIIEARKAMPGVPQVMVFDTEFHQTMPEKAYLYGLPYEFFKRYSVRRYGFHGISHKYVSERAAVMLGKRKPNVITCHLGAGSSITAVKEGISVDTSMGMTPLEGVMMSTRTGDLDPSIMQYLVKRHGFDYDGLLEIMNNRSGLLGLSGVSKDMRDVQDGIRKGNRLCRIAFDVFCYRVAKYIGSYFAAVGKVDAIVFTGGIGENSIPVRKEVCSYLAALGARIDPAKNGSAVKKERDISARGSRVKILVIPTNEALMIAKEAASVVE